MKLPPVLYRLIKNFTSLAIIQGANFVLPLLIIPYLIKVVGIEKFGLISFAQVLALYLVIFSEYGFNLSATKEVAENREKSKKLEYIYNATITTRLFLCFIAFVFLCLLTFSIPSLRKDYSLYILSSTMFIGQALMPTWFFLGMEQMRFITYINLLAKSVLTISTFIFIVKPEDFIYANMLHGIGSLIAGLICIVIIKKKFGIRPALTNYTSVKERLRSAFSIFISNFSTNIYLNVNIIILQFFTSESTVGMYSVAEKVFAALKNLISVIFQAIYPFACKLKTESRLRFIAFFTAYTYISLIFFTILGIFIYYFSDKIIYLIANKQLNESVALLKYFSFIPVVLTLSIPSFQSSLIFKHDKQFSYIMICAAAINITTNIILTIKYGAYGTALTVALTELFVMLSLNILIYRSEKLFFLNLKNIRKFRS